MKLLYQLTPDVLITFRVEIGVELFTVLVFTITKNNGLNTVNVLLIKPKSLNKN